MDQDLFEAIAAADLAGVRSALDAGATVDAIVDEYRTTPLMRAASSGLVDIVRLLLERGADANAGDSGAWTPLRYAISGGERTVGILLDAGAAMEAQECLGGEAAPEALRGLWKVELAADGILDDTRYGEVELVKTMEEFFPPGYFADPVSDAMKARLAEIRFFAREADANFLGLWKHRKGLPIAEAPVIVLDNEGTFRLTAPTIQDHFFVTALEADGGKAGPAVKALKKHFTSHGIPAPSRGPSIRKALASLPDPSVRG